MPSTTLQIHYRSAYRELIQFSNASFYVNRLSVPARHPADEIRRKRPIELIRVDGIYEDQTNPAEAQRVADVLRDIWANGGPQHRRPIGVVTFNRKQADLIEDVLEDTRRGDPAFRAALTRERDRIEGGEDMGFFVKNVEERAGRRARHHRVLVDLRHATRRAPSAARSACLGRPAASGG